MALTFAESTALANCATQSFKQNAYMLKLGENERRKYREATFTDA